MSPLVVMGPLESYYSRQALIAESKGDWEDAYTYGVQARHYRNELSGSVNTEHRTAVTYPLASPEDQADRGK